MRSNAHNVILGSRILNVVDVGCIAHLFQQSLQLGVTDTGLLPELCDPGIILPDVD